MIRAGDRALVPLDGLYDLVNGLLGDDAVPYARGGSVYKSNAAFGSSGLRWIWDGRLAGGRRTAFYTGDKFGTLAANDATPAELVAGGAPAPARAVVVNGILVVEGIARAWAGSRETGGGLTGGTVTVSPGSKTVTGVGTGWVTNAVGSGWLFRLPVGGVIYLVAVKSVESNTSLTLAQPWTGPAASGIAQTIFPGALAIDVPSEVDFAVEDAILGTIAGRLLMAGGDKMWFGGVGNLGAAISGTALGDDDYHAFDGEVLGLETLRDAELVFTSSGVSVVSGMHNEFTDPDGNLQHRVERVSDDMILWHRAGTVGWRGSLIVPALDAVWLMDTVGAPVRISDAITDLYRLNVSLGYRPGRAAVHRGHYFLPIIDSSANVIDVLVCRLTETRAGGAFAWGRLSGFAACPAYAVRVPASGPSTMFGASREASSRVVQTAFFSPSATYKNDADGSTPPFVLATGDIATGNMVSNFIKRIRVLFSLVDAATDDPDLELAIAIDQAPTYTALTPDAAEAKPGRRVWQVKKRARYISVRLRSIGPSAELKIRSLEFFKRNSGRY